MKGRIILTLGLFLFGTLGCTDVAIPLSSDPSQGILSGTNENESGTNENE
ncbi:MAG: hypothetical protein ACE5HZ_01520 [Fidelibacterota bacterium]